MTRASRWKMARSRPVGADGPSVLHRTGRRPRLQELRVEARGEDQARLERRQFLPHESQTGALKKGYEAQISNSHTDKRRTGGLIAIEDIMDNSPAKDDEWFNYDICCRQADCFEDQRPDHRGLHGTRKTRASQGGAKAASSHTVRSPCRATIPTAGSTTRTSESRSCRTEQDRLALPG